MKKWTLPLLCTVASGMLNLPPLLADSSIRVGVSAHAGAVRSVRIAPGRWHNPVHGFASCRVAGVPVVVVPPGNWGRVDFNVNPENSSVYVDGAYIGIADQWNGGFFGTTATLKSGSHRIRIVAPDGRTITRTIYVMPGKELNFNFDFNDR